MSNILDKYQEHRLVKFWLATKLFIFVNEPELIEQVLKSPKCLDKSFFYKFFRLDKGLLSLKCESCQLLSFVVCCYWQIFSLLFFPIVKDDTWEIHRKLLEPSFHHETVAEFITTFNDSTKLMRECLDSSEDNLVDVDILRVTSKCALTMVLATSFGITTTEVHFSDEILKAVEE